MSAQVEHGRSHSQQNRSQHLNMSTPLNPRTLDTIQCEITKEMISAIAIHARNVIPCTPAPALTSPDRMSSATADPACAQRPTRSGLSERLPSPPATPGAGTLTNIPPLDVFITNLVLRSRVQAGTLICTLVYLQRLHHRLPKEARGMECTCHRIFLASLIVAGKYLNDASPKNKYWARYSTMFTVAEVNLMEKQLLFLLDFDLRIDNEDLNEAASAFHSSNSKHAAPLTPTTPPFSASLSHPASADAANATSSVSARSKVDSADSAAPSNEPRVQHQPHQKGMYPHVYPETARIYPPTLGLGNHADCANHSHSQHQQKSQIAPCTDRRMSHQPLPSELDPSSMVSASELPNDPRQHNPATRHDKASRLYTAKPRDRRHHTDTAKPQLSFDPNAAPRASNYNQQHGTVSASSCEPLQYHIGPYHQSVGSQIGLAHTPSAGPLNQLSAEDQFHLRPSPKKRAVSRGHHSNIPHPSPIYHRGPGSGIASSSATAAPSAATSSSAYFLQPLEQTQSSYARSRYQQQRYDPGASRNAGSKTTAPRMAISIPSLRKFTRTDSPELSLAANGPILTRKSQKGRHILRHQSTAPDIGKISNMVSGASSIPFSASLAQYSKDIRGSQPHCKLLANDPDLPVRPLPARLASVGSSAMDDASPVHTLVYEESPAVSLGMAASEGYSQCLVGQAHLSSHAQGESGDSNERTLTAPPVAALSGLSFGAHMHPPGSNSLCQRHEDGSCTPPGIHGKLMVDENGALCNSAHGGGDASNSSGSGGGWQLKTKILHPLSAWFRLSRHQHSRQSPGHKQYDDVPQQAPHPGEGDAGAHIPTYARNNSNGAFSTSGNHDSKGASAPSLPSKRLRDRGLGTCSLSPIYLEPPVAPPISAPSND
ncbi:PHO85 cyclin-1 [Coemansia sp. RSA 2399]|nr:PHO85 cyclin-1 [Coemansia sp. RSA 2399]